MTEWVYLAGFLVGLAIGISIGALIVLWTLYLERPVDDRRR